MAAQEAIVQDRLDHATDTILTELAPLNIIDGHFLNQEGLQDQKNKWRIVEWGENDQHSLTSAPFEWIRMDAEFEWICQINLDQPDYMWASQLEKDKDSASQYDAAQELYKYPSHATSTTLMRTIMTDCKLGKALRCQAVSKVMER